MIPALLCLITPIAVLGCLAARHHIACLPELSAQGAAQSGEHSEMPNRRGTTDRAAFVDEARPPFEVVSATPKIITSVPRNRLTNESSLA